jgi:hypothetical protein
MQSNSEYLTLALDVRRLTDSLIELVEGGTPSPELGASIQEVVASLEGAGSKVSVKGLRERGAFGRYAGARAIGEAVIGLERNKIVEVLLSVIRPQAREQRIDSALAAIQFFDTVERRALYHYNRAQAAKRSVSAA